MGRSGCMIGMQGKETHQDVLPLEGNIDTLLIVQALRKGGKPVHCLGAVLPQVRLALILHMLESASLGDGDFVSQPECSRMHCDREQMHMCMPQRTERCCLHAKGHQEWPILCQAYTPPSIPSISSMQGSTI